MTDSTFLDQIRLTEKQAAQLITEAQENAQTSQEAVRMKIIGRLDEARTEAARIRQAIFEDAETKAEAITRETTAAADEEAREITASVKSRLEQAVQVVSERIVSLSVDR